jgi:lauroyl/myristoyl acyltransferase
MTRTPLFNPWKMRELKPLYELLKALDADDAHAAMRALHAAERPLLLQMHDACVARVRPRLALAPALAAFDLDELARQFADYVFELNFETTYLTMNLDNAPRLLNELVDLGNIEVFAAARAQGPVLLTPLHVGPCYGSLGVFAHYAPLTTLYHGITLDELCETWGGPGLDLQGIQVPGENIMARCLEVLASGRTLSMFPELDPNGIGPLHVPVPFMGTQVAAPTGPALVAQRAGAQIVPFTFASTAPGRYAFHFQAAIDPGRDAHDRHRVTAQLFAFAEETLLAGEPGKWEMWWDFDQMADAAWIESQNQRAAA